jgi:hypothetical protein
MEWSVELDENERFIRATEWGDFDLDDQASFLSDIFTSPYWRPGFGVLIDYRDLNLATLTEGDLEAIRVIFQSVRKRIEASKLAIFCATDESFEIGKAFAELMAPKVENQVVVFRDENAAIAWLTAGTPGGSTSA